MPQLRRFLFRCSLTGFSCLLAASAAGAERLEVRVAGHHFDPLADGEPALAPAERADAAAPGLRLVQFHAPVRQEWLASLAAAGLRPLQYYPHQTYLVWGGSEQVQALGSPDFLRWLGLFHPAYKLSPELEGRTGMVDRVEVLFYDGGRRAATLEALTELGAELVSIAKAQPDGAFVSAVARLDAAAFDAVAALPEVWWLGYKSPRVRIEDEMSDQIVAGNHPGGVPVTGYLPYLGGLGVDGTGVRWAIVDTGVDYQHPDLGPRIVGGWTAAGTSCNPPGQPGSDCADGGHGTHVAGIVAGDATAGFTDGAGFLYGLGMAPGTEIFAMNIFGSGAEPLQEYSKQAFLGGAIGSNNSWTTGEGTPHGYQASERTYDFMVRDANFDTPGTAEPHIVVFSAGNSGPGAMTLTAPKEAKNVIVTAGTSNYRASGNDIEAMYASSSRGPTVDGRFGPTIAAPGRTIASARNDLGGSCSTAISGTSNLYALCTGTSMASPHAAGAVALIAEDWRSAHAGADPSPAMAMALLINGAVDIQGTPPIPNPDEGWGRIDIDHVLAPETSLLAFDQDELLDDPGDTWTLQVLVEDVARPLKVTLVWSDAPGAIGANPALVNNLDLTVVNGSNTYLGNRFSGGWSVSGGAADSLHNQENVYVQLPAGQATITVSATAINGDGVPLVGDGTDQDFALVCSNCIAAEPIFADGFESGNTSAWSAAVP